MNAIMGIYRLYNPADGQSFIGFSRHIEGTRKRLTFELKLNACSYKPLQAFYNACGGELAFETLETFAPPPTMSDEEIDGYLLARMYYRKGQLGAQSIQVSAY